jgi:hypothetical protein
MILLRCKYTNALAATETRCSRYSSMAREICTYLTRLRFAARTSFHADVYGKVMEIPGVALKLRSKSQRKKPI